MFQIKNKLKQIYIATDSLLGNLFFSVRSIEDISSQVKKIWEFDKIKYPQNKLNVITKNETVRERINNVNKYSFNQQYIFNPKVFQIDGQNIRITSGGFAILRNKIVILESVLHQEIYFRRNRKNWNVILELFKKPSIEDDVFVFSRNLDFNYWHSTVEILAEINLIISTLSKKKLTVIVEKNLNNVHIEQIQHLFGNKINLKFYTKPIVSKNIYLTNRPFDYIEQNGVNLMVRKFNFWEGFNNFLLPDIGTPPIDILIISRQKTNSRRLLNEKEIFNKLSEKYNTQLFCLENESWLEQIKIMSNAKMILSIHGAAGANLLFLSNLIYFEIVDLERKRGLVPIDEIINICTFSNIWHIIYDCKSLNESEDYIADLSDVYLEINNAFMG